MKSLLTGLVLTMLLFTPAGASAAPCTDYDDGKRALVAKAFDKAVEVFQRCAAQRETASPLLGLALALELRGDLRRSALVYRRFLHETSGLASGTWAAKRSKVRTILAKLDGALAKKGWGVVEITSSPPGAAVWVDGLRYADFDQAAVTPLAIMSPHGAIEVTVSLQGHVSQDRKVTVSATVSGVSVTLQPEPKAASSSPAPKSAMAKLPPPPQTKLQEVREVDEVFWVPVGVGLASLVAGVGVLGAALGEVDTYHAAVNEPGGAGLTRAIQSRDRLTLMERTYWALFGIGAASLIGGVIAHFAKEPTRYEVLVGATRDGAAAGVSGRF